MKIFWANSFRNIFAGGGGGIARLVAILFHAMSLQHDRLQRQAFSAIPPHPKPVLLGPSLALCLFHVSVVCKHRFGVACQNGRGRYIIGLNHVLGDVF